MRMPFSSPPSVLMAPDGFYIHQNTWKPLRDLSQCPKEINLYIHGFPITLDHQKLPPMNPLRRHQLLRARLRHEVEIKQSLGWASLLKEEHGGGGQDFYHLTTAFLNGPIEAPALKDWGIQVHHCHWLSFGFERLMAAFQNQQPCGGVLALGHTLNGQWQLLFGLGSTLKLMRPIPLQSQIESMIQETFHYCLNEYGIDPADIKLLNLTDLDLEESYRLASYAPKKSLEDILMDSFVNQSGIQKIKGALDHRWAYPQGTYPFGEEPNWALSLTLKSACVLALCYLLSGGYETWHRTTELQKLEEEMVKLTGALDELQKPLQFTADPDWEVLERFTGDLNPSKVFDRLRDLAPLAQEQCLIQEFLWSLEDKGETLKIRYSDHPDHLNGSDGGAQLHGIIYQRLKNLWGEKAQVELHNNRIEVIF